MSNHPKEQRRHLHHGGSLKSRRVSTCFQRWWQPNILTIYCFTRKVSNGKPAYGKGESNMGNYNKILKL